MIINTATNGDLIGRYMSAKGEAAGYYTMFGRFDPTGATLGWTVAWQNANLSTKSTTTWCGTHKKDIITTTWLLTRETLPGEEWNSTAVGFDNFARGPPHAAVLERALNCAGISHPKSAFD